MIGTDFMLLSHVLRALDEPRPLHLHHHPAATGPDAICRGLEGATDQLGLQADLGDSPMSQRFVKIAANGEQLPSDAIGHVAILDCNTGLMWVVEEAPEMTMFQAEKHARALSIAGFSDWQLPTRVQLLTLIDDERHVPAIDTNAFPGCKPDWYLTRTPYASGPADHVWHVCFSYGASDWQYRRTPSFVRPVRNAVDVVQALLSSKAA